MSRIALGACVFALVAALSSPAFAQRLEFVCQPAEGKALIVRTEKVGGRDFSAQWSEDGNDYLVRFRVDMATAEFELQASHGFDTDWQDFAGEEWSGSGWLAAATILRSQPQYVARVRVEKAATSVYSLTFFGDVGAPGELVYEYSSLGAEGVSGIMLSSCTVEPWR